MDELARTYSNFHHAEYQDFSRKITENISNTTTDRVAVNHAAIQRINENWDKSLNEINCHLHPLDTIASYCHAAIKPLETGRGQSYVKDRKHCSQPGDTKFPWIHQPALPPHGRARVLDAKSSLVQDKPGTRTIKPRPVVRRQ